MKLIASAVLTLLAVAPRTAQAQGADEIMIVPRPASMQRAAGSYTVKRSTVIVTDASLAPLGRTLSDYLAPALGARMTVRARRGSQAPDRIELRRDTSLATRLGTEGYVLRVRPEGVVIRAAGDAGVFYGIQTLRQLLPPETFGDGPVKAAAWTVPSVDIEDKPRFGWRGMHLDVGRHFMPKEFVKRYIEVLALHKMNTFHWHLTEDQGWRIEIKQYPKLTSVGGWRNETIIGRRDRRDSTKDRYDGTRHGGFYTQADVREVVAFAAARFINVVPEIEMPGHVQAAIAAYPELGVTGDSMGVWTRWGVSENILNADESTVKFFQNVLDEVLTLFPSKFIHVGGDEAVKKQWDTSPRMQARMKELGVKDSHELQSWFIKRMDTYLAAKGRRLVGWDEILEGGLASGATVMSWRGVQGGIDAARAGHDVVMSPTTYAYLDYYQARDTTTEPLAIGGFLPLDSVYSYEPVPAELTAEEARHVLGAQGNLWTEYIKTPEHAEFMAFPRAIAIAEVVWTPREQKSFSDFSRRLDTHLRRLDALGVKYRKPKVTS